MTALAQAKPRIVFIANCVYGDHVAGGDIHFFQMAQAAMDAGYMVHFFGGHALKNHLAKRQIAATQTLTDHKPVGAINSESFSGQLRLLLDYVGRFWRTLFKLSEIRGDDIVYAVTDYWFDVWPAAFSKARGKIMIWHMRAPSFAQIVRKSRPDINSARVASFYYWLGQNLSLKLFRFCRNKRLLFVHPNMRETLLKLGFYAKEIEYISFGVETNRSAPYGEEVKSYDAIWLGRVHRQKGIDDLLATLEYLAGRIDNFRAVLVGNLEAELGPQIKRLGLSDCVEFSGFVSEQRKFQLFNASRVFLMTSLFEGSPRVVAEALVCHVPVVAYDVDTYRPIFGNFLRYIPCFNLKEFQNEARFQIEEMRVNKNYLAQMNIIGYSESHSWNTTAKVFLGNVEQLCETQTSPA